MADVESLQPVLDGVLREGLPHNMSKTCAKPTAEFAIALALLIMVKFI
jgi:hypothetical protein